MDCIYVVTFGALDAEVGEFHDLIAYQNKGEAEMAVKKCMNRLGGSGSFNEVSWSGEDYVVAQYNNATHSIWLERLKIK